MPKVIIIGATSGIGRGLAKVFFEQGYSVGITGRRAELLESLKEELHSVRSDSNSDKQKCFVQPMDLKDIEGSINQLNDLIEVMGGMDLIVLNSGVGFRHDPLNFEQEKETIDVNVTGFVALANLSFNYFIEHGGGQLVGISSIASLRGRDEAPAYNASKAFISTYMEGLRHKSVKYNRKIFITDIRPGFVQTAMASNPRAFWSAPVDIASLQMYKAIKRKKKVAYITKRWKLIAILLHILPDWIYNRI